jgi:hypothetical protein
MTDWVPVLIMALVVVCVTAYLLLETETPSTKKRPLGPGPFHQPTNRPSHWISGYSGVLRPVA